MSKKLENGNENSKEVKGNEVKFKDNPSETNGKKKSSTNPTSKSQTTKKKKSKYETKKEREERKQRFLEQQRLRDLLGSQVNLDQFEDLLKSFEVTKEQKKEIDPETLTFEEKLLRTKMLIMESVEQFGEEGVYIAFSGGKDSSVLAHIVHSIYPNIPLVFANTGLEYPELVKFVKSQRDKGKEVVMMKPRKSFKQVLDEYGYPLISKEVSMAISRYQKTKSAFQKRLRLFGGFNYRTGKMQKTGVIPKKWRFIKDKYKVTERCCDYFKKMPFTDYEKETGRRMSFVGVRTQESNLRKRSFNKQGCNAFKLKRPQSRPIMFWNDSDIEQYIKENNVELCEVYYDKWVTDPLTGSEVLIPAENRTSCIFCMYGVAQEMKQDPENTRFHKLKLRQPKLFKYSMDKLGLREILKDVHDLVFDDDPDYNEEYKNKIKKEKEEIDKKRKK